MPAYTSALLCDHANENPHRCRCPSNCYCKAHTCRDPNRLADHPPQRAALPPRTVEEASRLLGQFPHCDALVLHKPGECEYCDGHPDWQAIRMLYGINFTGEGDPKKLPCPAEARRSAPTIHRWHGNRPTNAEVRFEERTRYERELDEEMDRLDKVEDQLPETD